MKHFSLAIAVFAGLSPVGFANEGPCQKVRAACEAAGYKRGGHKEGKGLFKDCMKKLADGQTLPGVSATPQDMAACKAKRAERSQSKKSSNH